MPTHLSTTEAADRLGLPLRTIQRACRTYLDTSGARGMRCVDIGNRIRVPESALEGWGSADPGQPTADELVARVDALEAEITSQARMIGELTEYVAAYSDLLAQLPTPPRQRSVGSS